MAWGFARTCLDCWVCFALGERYGDVGWDMAILLGWGQQGGLLGVWGVDLLPGGRFLGLVGLSRLQHGTGVGWICSRNAVVWDEIVPFGGGWG